jgi:crossover junction endodeoxyribonuclease RuvC
LPLAEEVTTVILGVDPGTRFTGWGVIALDGDGPRAIAFDVISPKPRLPIEQRLHAIFLELGEIIARYQPAAMAVEEPFVGANVRSAMAVSEARTVAMLAATAARMSVYHYSPARVKRMVAGYGQGDKAQVREMLRLQLAMEAAPSDLNASDALAVALCHAMEHQAATILTRAAHPGQ